MTPEEYNEMIKNGSKSVQAINSPMGRNQPQKPTGKTLCEVFAQEATQPLKPLITHFTLKPSTDEAKLNKGERAFLQILKSRSYPWLGIQCVTLKLGDDCRYTPDFSAVTQDGKMLFFEFKGFMRDDARVKLVAAARRFNWATFVLVTKDKTGLCETEIKS